MRAVTVVALVLSAGSVLFAGSIPPAQSQSPGSSASQEPSLVARGSEKPSFDCAKAKTAAARLICADGELARLDGELGVAFQKRKAQLAPPDQSKFVADQLAWIRDRNTRCDLDGKSSVTIEVLANSKLCMMNAIRERITSLAQTETTAAPAAPASGQPTVLTPPASSRSSEAAPCEFITDKQSRISCFEHAGVPMIDCNLPRDADEAAFCRTLPPRRPAPVASVPPPMPSPDVARAAMIADDTGQWAGTIRVDTLKIDSTGKGGAVVCHQSEHGPSCNAWTFDCDRFALLDKMFAHSDYFPSFMQTPNARSTPEQNAELEAMNAVATKLPATACRLGGMAPPVENPQWIEVRENSGEVKATIDVATVERDANGNAHARVCLNSEPGVTCPNSKIILRWYFDCRTHEFSWLDTTFMPQLPREMKPAQPNSVADKLATFACR